jgi:hypothetical protein
MCDNSVNVFLIAIIKKGYALKVVYPVCCGADVYKTFLVTTIITSQGITLHYSKKQFLTFNNSISQIQAVAD